LAIALFDEVNDQACRTKNDDGQIEGKAVHELFKKFGLALLRLWLTASTLGWPAENPSGTCSFEIGGGLVILISGHVRDGSRFFQSFGKIVTRPFLRIMLLDFIQMFGKTSAALLNLVGLFPQLIQLPINQGDRRGKFFGEFNLLGKKRTFATGQLFKLAFFTL